MDPSVPRYGDELAVVTVTYSPGRAPLRAALRVGLDVRSRPVTRSAA